MLIKVLPEVKTTDASASGSSLIVPDSVKAIEVVEVVDIGSAVEENIATATKVVVKKSFRSHSDEIEKDSLYLISEENILGWVNE